MRKAIILEDFNLATGDNASVTAHIMANDDTVYEFYSEYFPSPIIIDKRYADMEDIRDPRLSYFVPVNDVTFNRKMICISYDLTGVIVIGKGVKDILNNLTNIMRSNKNWIEKIKGFFR